MNWAKQLDSARREVAGWPKWMRERAGLYRSDPMTPERKTELRNTWRYHTVVTECLDEIDRLEALLADCKPLDDAIRREQMERDCRAVCVYCRKGREPFIAQRPPLTGMWAHSEGSCGEPCGAHHIRKAFEEKNHA